MTVVKGMAGYYRRRPGKYKLEGYSVGGNEGWVIAKFPRKYKTFSSH